MIDCKQEGIWQETIEITDCGETVQAETRWISLFFYEMFQSITNTDIVKLTMSVSKETGDIQ